MTSELTFYLACLTVSLVAVVISPLWFVVEFIRFIKRRLSSKMNAGIYGK